MLHIESVPDSLKSKMSSTPSLSDRVLLPSNVKPVSYDITLSPDLVNFTFDGICSIDIIVSSVTNTITMHAKDLDIQTVRIGDAQGVITYDEKLSRCVFTFEKELKLGPSIAPLIINYKGNLNSDMAGFYRSKYKDHCGKEQYMASTQFEALDARRAFPCWDEPAVKAVFILTMIVPEDLTAVANMPETSCSLLQNNLKKITFEKTPIMSTYLVAFAVGRFDYLQGKTKNGIIFRVYCQPGRVQHAKFALETGIRCLQFLDDYFEIPYPLPKCDMMSITEFAAGAMENWGLITYRESAILIDEASAEVSMKQRVAMVVCHELAHQWFGNLVTMNWWCDLWLNEGFANFTQHFVTDALFPEWKIWENYAADSVGMQHNLHNLFYIHQYVKMTAYAFYASHLL